jgi:hypothetical protein
MTQTTDNQKATVRQKAPRENPNMKTDTQTELKRRPSEAEITRLAGLQAAQTHKWNGWDWKAYQTSITRQNHHISKIEAHAAKLAEALRDMREGYQRMFDVMPVAWQTYDHIAESALAEYEEAKP